MTENNADIFRHNGYLIGLDILSQEEVEHYLQCFYDYQERLGGNVTGAYRFKGHLLLPWMYQLASHPKILNIVTAIFGPDILCWSSDMFPKEPGTGKVCGWHQDATYVGMDPPDALTVWIALTESTKVNGCVKYSRGSHVKGQIPHNKTFNEQSMLLYGQEIPVEVDPDTAVSAVLSPGQASVHHIMTVHASDANNSDKPRIGIAFRYCGAYVKQSDSIDDSATLVCGRDLGNFPLEPVPVREFGKQELEAHKKAVGKVGPDELIANK